MVNGITKGQPVSLMPVAWSVLPVYHLTYGSICRIRLSKIFIASGITQEYFVMDVLYLFDFGLGVVSLLIVLVSSNGAGAGSETRMVRLNKI